MQIDLTLNDEDRDIVFEVSVTARVVEEIGGSPGYCCDIENVSVNRVTVVIVKSEYDLDLTCGPHDEMEAYIKEQFDEEIAQHCIEHFEGRRLAEPVRDASVERGLRALADDRPKLAEKCRTIVLRHDKA